MNLHFVVFFYRTKTAEMWHECSKSGEVPASRVVCVSKTRRREQMGDLLRVWVSSLLITYFGVISWDACSVSVFTLGHLTEIFIWPLGRKGSIPPVPVEKQSYISPQSSEVLHLQGTLRFQVAVASGVTTWEGNFSLQNWGWTLDRFGWPFTV